MSVYIREEPGIVMKAEAFRLSKCKAHTPCGSYYQKPGERSLPGTMTLYHY